MAAALNNARTLTNHRCSLRSIRSWVLFKQTQAHPQRPRCHHLHNVPSKEPFKILLFGRDEFSCIVLEELYKCRDVWQDIWIATTPDTRIGRRGSVLSVSPLKNVGNRLDLPIAYVPPKQEFKQWEPPPPFSLGTTPSSNHCLITASFGRFIPSRLLNSFAPSRRLNVHPSLLPLYRGPAPIQHTIADGRTETGVCVIEMKELKEGADVGDVWGRESTVISSEVHFSSLRDKLAAQGGRLLVSVLRQMMNGTAVAVPQSSFSQEIRHATRITPETAAVDFKSWDAHKIERMHRAISHQKPLTTHLPNSSRTTLQLHSPALYLSIAPNMSARLQTPGAATFDSTSKTLIIRCAGDSYVSVPLVKQQDRALISARDWWNGNVWKDWVVHDVVHFGA